MSRATNFLIVVILWALIYLPGLGSLEIKGEEGRRILPAVTMIETGNYLVPQVGSEPYFRKPPLINWLVALSFRLTGMHNEWSARFPSVLSILAVALAFVSVARTTLGPSGSLIAALVWMTNFGMIEKGRLIEIEAVYVSLVGLALICWLASWQQRRSPWLVWLIPAAFLGLGLLAKGPVHLLFFYCVVVAVLYRAGELRSLFQLPHIAGVLIMSGIFASWAIPYWLTMQGANLPQVWSAQLTGRLGLDDFNLTDWLLNIPRGLAYFLPWALLLPLAAEAKPEEERAGHLLFGLLWGCAIPFLFVNLLPSALPRYSMPVLPGACWLMALTLSAPEINPPPWWRLPQILTLEIRKRRLVLPIAVLTAVIMMIYGFAVVPSLQRRSKIKPIAAQIDALIPQAEPLYAVDPDYQPFLFYTRSRLIYVDRLDEVPASANYLLIQPDKEQQAIESEQWAPRHAKSILHITDYRKRTVILLKTTDP